VSYCSDWPRPTCQHASLYAARFPPLNTKYQTFRSLQAFFPDSAYVPGIVSLTDQQDGYALACKLCNKPATEECGGCSGAQQYYDSPIEPTYYCSRECQVADRDEHKSLYQKLQARKRLHRAVSVLKGILIKVSTLACRREITAVVLQCTTLHLTETVLDHTDWPGYKPLDCLSLENEPHLESVIMLHGSTFGIMSLGGFLKELLRGENAPSPFRSRRHLLPS
jgi:hypothetical protein